MSYIVTAKCPGCRAGYLVNCRIEGVAEPASTDAHCFECERCGLQLNAPVPANAKRDTIRVVRDHQSQ